MNDNLSLRDRLLGPNPQAIWKLLPFLVLQLAMLPLLSWSLKAMGPLPALLFEFALIYFSIRILIRARRQYLASRAGR